MKSTYDPTAKAEALSRLPGALRAEAHSIYDPTAKAEALSRLLGALRAEAHSIKVWLSELPENATVSRLFTHKTVIQAEIAYLEIIQAEWQSKAEEFQLWLAQTGNTEKRFEERTYLDALEEIPPDQSATPGGQAPPAGAEQAPQPFLTPERRAAAEAIVARKGQTQE